MSSQKRFAQRASWRIVPARFWEAPEACAAIHKQHLNGADCSSEKALFRLGPGARALAVMLGQLLLQVVVG
jgi:hypothetical protein